MEIILTHGYYIAEDEKEQAIMRPYPPLGILYISGWLELNNIDHEVFDTTFSNKKEHYAYLKDKRPKVIGIYTNLMTKVNVIELMSFLKKEVEECVIVLGGPDVRYNIEDYLDAGAAALVVGEGEQTMYEIIKSVQNGVENEFGHIEGVAYRSPEGVIKTPERKKIKEIDDLPFPNRKKIDMVPYLNTWKEFHGQSAMTISTQRGCPYTCKWCSTAVYGQSYRRRSPALVAKELKYLKNTFQPDTVWFVDDVFTVSHKWLEAFAEEVVAQDAVIPFECITRADRMNEQVILWLKKAGAFRIWIGAESGSQKVIDLMDRRVDVNKVRDMIKMTRQNGMEAGTFIMLGYPGEEEEDIIATANHLKQSSPDHFTITVAYPIKGTSLYQEVEAVQTKDIDWMTSSDRDRDFKRAYSRKYYDYAVRWVENEVRSHILWNEKRSVLPSLKMKLKAILFRALMLQNRTFHTS